MKHNTILLSAFIALIFALSICSALLAVLLLQNRPSICPHPSFTERKIEPTCAEEGKIVRECAVCDYEYVCERLACSEHTLLSMSLPPTCDSQGYTIYYCECGYSYRADFQPPLEHKLECEIIAPTCEENGYTRYFCANCSYSYESDLSAPSGHSFEKTLHLPTATSAGYTEYTCDCSYSYRGDYVYYSDILESAYCSGTDVLARGIDVSRWNHQIDTASGEYLPLDWGAIKAQGVDFVILKAGSTKSGIEPTFLMDYEGAKAAGLEIGAYFYTYSTTVAGITHDAEMLLLWLEGKQFEYPIYLDLEDTSLSGLGKNHLSAMCEAFLCKLQQSGYYAGLYTNHTWLTTILDTPRMVTLFDLWYARYPLTERPVWNEEKYGKQLGMWQYTESGVLEGIDGYFDLNFSYKNYAEIMKKWGLNGF